MGYEIQFDDSTKFYYSIVAEEDLLSVLGGSSSITAGGNSTLDYSNDYSSDPHFKICKYCYENAAVNCYCDVTREGTKMYPIYKFSTILANKRVTSDNDNFSKNKTIYVAFTIHGIALPKVDGNTGSFDGITTGVVDQEIELHNIPITGDISMSYCGDNSYISVNDTKYLISNGSNQQLTNNPQLEYVCYHGYTLRVSSSDVSRDFACTMLYKVVFPSSLNSNLAEIYRTSINNESKIVLNLLTNPSNFNYRMQVRGRVGNKGETTGTTNFVSYDFYFMKRTLTPGSNVEETPCNLTLEYNRGSYPFSYNFSVLGNKILPVNKNYYLCKRIRENNEILNGKIIDFYFLQNYENNMTPSSCEVDIMYDSSSNENVAYVPSGSAAVYLTGKLENFVYPIFKNEANELVHYTTFLDNLKYLTISNPASSNATSIASGITVPIPAVGSIDFASPENCSATHTPFGYTYQYKIDVKPKEGLEEEINNMTKKYTLNFNFLYYGSNIPYTDSSICLSTLNDYKGFGTSGEDDPNKALTGENIITHSITNMPDNASSTLWYGIYKTEGTPGITGFALYNNTSDAQAISPDNDATRCISKQYVPFQIAGTSTRPTGTASYAIPTSGGITGEYSSDKPRLISISGNAVS